MAQPTLVGQNQAAGSGIAVNVGKRPAADSASKEVVEALSADAEAASLGAAVRGHDGLGHEAGAPETVASTPAAGSTKGAKSKARKGAGLSIERRFTSEQQKPFDALVWERRTSVIAKPDGSQVFRMDGAEIPAGWSQLATDIVVSKYFRKAGIGGDPKTGESSVRQVVGRIARTIRKAGESFGRYFATARDAEVFEDELTYLMVNQYGALNSPV